MYEKLNEHIINKIVIINKLKCDKPELFQNINLELYLSQDTTKVKLNQKFFDLKNKINKLKTFIGEWDSVLIKLKQKKNKSTLSETVKNIRNNFKLLDIDYQTELHNKLITLNSRLATLNEGQEEFYHYGINKQKIDELTKNFKSCKEIEHLIYSTIEKLEGSKNSHEESAYIFVKLKELVYQQQKINDSITENEEILTKVNENMKDNIKLMKNNLELIKTKFSKIKEKLKL